MNFEKIMFDKSTNMKFELFKYINLRPNQQFLVKDIAEKYALTYQQVMILVHNIIKDEEQLNGHAIHQVGNGRISINEDTLAVSIDRYRLYLLKNESIPFNYLIYIMENQQGNEYEFTKKSSISISTLYRKTATLKQFLKQYRLRLGYGKSMVKGDERLVRIVLFQLLWLGTNGLEIPYHYEETAVQATDAYIHEHPELTEFNYQRLLLLFTIIDARYRGENFLSNRHGNWLKCDQQEDILAISRLLGEDVTLNPKRYLNENSFLHYFMYQQGVLSLDDVTNKKEFIMDFMEHYPTIYNFIFQLIKKVQESMLVFDNEKQLTYELCLIAYNQLTYQQVIPYFFTYAEKKQSKEEGERVEKILVNQFLSMDVAEELGDSYISYLDLCLQLLMRHLVPVTKQNYRVKIGIFPSTAKLEANDLVHYLNQMTIVDYEDFDIKKIDAYDMIIVTNSYVKEKFPRKDNLIYWDRTHYFDNYMELNRQLTKLYFENKGLVFYEEKVPEQEGKE
ncbi:MAG: helix-turn-helix domain-containing protein [Enterococcus sp.]